MSELEKMLSALPNGELLLMIAKLTIYHRQEGDREALVNPLGRYSSIKRVQ